MHRTEIILVRWCLTHWFLRLIDVNRFGAFTVVIVIADSTWMGFVARLAEVRGHLIPPQFGNRNQCVDPCDTRDRGGSLHSRPFEQFNHLLDTELGLLTG